MSLVNKEKWKSIVAPYQRPSFWRATWQLINSLGAHAFVWWMIYLSLSVSYWLTAALIVLNVGVMVRVFIIAHDCGHGSFFKSRRANDFWGFITSAMLFTPYFHWRWEHALHHSSSGNLDRRGVGDVWTLTVEEYLNSSRWRRITYRVMRNPFLLFVVAPFAYFFLMQRIPSKGANKRERHSVWWTNLFLLLMAIGMSHIFGFVPYLIIASSTMLLAGSVGVWLFYVQHQFEEVYWARDEDWDYAVAAIKGSSYYKLPRLLQWFTGNIGFHHIHHLSSRIPNYHLEKCHHADPLFQQATSITLISSLKSLTRHLFDESTQRLVSFGYLKKLRKSS